MPVKIIRESLGVVVVDGRRLRELTVLEVVTFELNLKTRPEHIMGRVPVQFEGRWYWDEGAAK